MYVRYREYTLALALALILTAGAHAAEPGGAQVSDRTELGSFPDLPPDSVDLAAGNITVVNLDVEASTFRWVGLMGNTTGSIVLGDGDSNVLFNWNASGNIVYASEGTPVWSNLQNVSEENVTTILPFLAAGANDAYNETFTNSPESIGSNLFTINATFAVTESANTTVWKTYALWDESDLVFAGKVVHGGVSFRSPTDFVDFQMILPEDGTQGGAVATTYNLWVENI